MAVWMVLWVVCGVIAAMIVADKGGNGVIGFLVGVLFGPLGIVAAFFLGDAKAKEAQQIAGGDSKKCPRCAELVKADALVCKHCGNDFAGTAAEQA